MKRVSAKSGEGGRPSSVSILAGAASAATEERHTNEVQRKSQVNRRSRYELPFFGRTALLT